MISIGFSKVKTGTIISIFIMLLAFLISCCFLCEHRANQILKLKSVAAELCEQNTKLTDNIKSLQTDIANLKETSVVYGGKYKITYYCCCKKCCNKWAENRPVDKNGKEIVYTANGSIAQEGVTVAADTSVLPFGTRIYIKGIGWRTVQDVGGKIQGSHIDIYVSSHDSPMPYGMQNLDVWVEVK